VVVLAGLLAVLVVGCVVVSVVWALVGALATDTVLVPPPHPPRMTVTAAARVSIEAWVQIGWVMSVCMVLTGNPLSRTP